MLYALTPKQEKEKDTRELIQKLICGIIICSEEIIIETENCFREFLEKYGARSCNKIVEEMKGIAKKFSLHDLKDVLHLADDILPFTESYCYYVYSEMNVYLWNKKKQQEEEQKKKKAKGIITEAWILPESEVIIFKKGLRGFAWHPFNSSRFPKPYLLSKTIDFLINKIKETIIYLDAPHGVTQEALLLILKSEIAEIDKSKNITKALIDGYLNEKNGHVYIVRAEAYLNSSTRKVRRQALRFFQEEFFAHSSINDRQAKKRALELAKRHKCSRCAQIYEYLIKKEDKRREDCLKNFR